MERNILVSGYLGEAYGGPLFLSHYSFCTLDPHGLGDAYCSDYLEQVHAHCLINYRYCRTRYSVEDAWGLSACDGPKGYVVNSPTEDHGIIATTAALSSIPFLPLRSGQAALRFLRWRDGALVGRFGLMDSFQPSTGWVSGTHLAINQGPVVAMMENYRSGLIWDLFMNATDVKNGLARLGFRQEKPEKEPVCGKHFRDRWRRRIIADGGHMKLSSNFFFNRACDLKTVQSCFITVLRYRHEQRFCNGGKIGCAIIA